MKKIKIKKVEKRTSFLQITAELDGEIYEGVLIIKGKEKDEKRNKDLVNSERQNSEI